MEEAKCPLCLSTRVQNFATDKLGSYSLCRQCYGVFRHNDEFLSAESERQRYLSHNNSLEDAGYLKFLSKLTHKLSPYLKKNMSGLDFGCGPVKAMEFLFSRDESLKSLNCTVDSYDPLFFPDLQLQENSYDFILASEVVEHFNCPRESFEKMANLLKSGGLLEIMTQTRKEEYDFLSWSYRRDPTHVFFFHQKTFDWLCRYYPLELVQQGANEFIFKKI